MSKQLYEEALADVKHVKQVAEDNAKRAVLDAVTPRIRQFIDKALLEEFDEENAPIEPGAPPPEGELLTDLVAVDPDASVPIDAAGSAAAITPPDEQGKVTLDVDALASSEPGVAVPPPMFGVAVPDAGEEFEISLESMDALRRIARRKDVTLGEAVSAVSNRVAVLKKAGPLVRATSGYRTQIAQMISRVEDMYEHVQERVSDPARKGSYETLLEASFKDLTKLQESMTMSQKKNALTEEDVTLTLTGLPDDIDLEEVGVDLATGSDDDESGDDADMGDDDGSLDDLDGLGGQGQDQQGQGDSQFEGRRLSDDTIVEIDEKMLRREISRMRRLRESHSGTGGSETKPQSWGNGADNFDSFGGGKDEGEFDDQEIVDKSPAPGALPLGEADEDLDEAQSQMEESDITQGLDETEMGPPPDGASSENISVAQEGKRRLGFEKRLQERAKQRAASLKKEAAAARSRKNGKRLAEIKKEYVLVARRYNESVARSKKFTKIVAEATKKINEARSNSAAARPAEAKADDSLRKKLAETNLFNAKLLYTNKLLQNEQLTTREKAQVIKQLDGVKTVREAKLVYESLASTLASVRKTVTEGAGGRQVIGSGSRATRPASTQALNEGYEAERWAQLAGITRR